MGNLTALALHEFDKRDASIYKPVRKISCTQIELCGDTSETPETPDALRPKKQSIDINLEITNKLQTEQTDEDEIHRILLVSTKSSGSSTLLRQLNNIHEYQESPENMTTLTKIRKQCMDNAISICKMVGDYNLQQELIFLSISKQNDLPKIAQKISTLWQNESVKQKYFYKCTDLKYGDKITENMDYYFPKIEQIMSPTYTSNVQDGLSCKSNYKSIQQLRLPSSSYEFIDIPSHLLKNGNIKKMYMFDDAKAMIFMVSLPDFCVYRSDIKQNAIKYSMQCFRNIIHNKYTENMDIILFFTKYDIFFEQIKRGIPLSLCFDQANDGWDVSDNYGNVTLVIVVAYLVRNVCRKSKIGEMPAHIVQLIENYLIMPFNEDEHDHQTVDKYCTNAMHFIKEKFEQVNENKNRKIYFHALDVMDEYSVKNVCWHVQNTLSRNTQTSTASNTPNTSNRSRIISSIIGTLTEITSFFKKIKLI